LLQPVSSVADASARRMTVWRLTRDMCELRCDYKVQFAQDWSIID
jgi:hypothetical protein